MGSALSLDYGSLAGKDFSCLNRGSYVSEVPLNRITRSLTMAQSGFVDARDAVSIWMIKKDDLIFVTTGVCK